MSTFAVRYTQPLLGAANAAGYLVAVPGVSVLIRQNGIACAVYANNTKTVLANPVPTGVAQGTPGVDTTGNLTIYLEPGRGYDGVSTVGTTVSNFALPDISPDAADVAANTAAIATATGTAAGLAIVFGA